MLRSPVREIINYRPSAAAPRRPRQTQVCCHPRGDYILVLPTRIQTATVGHPARRLTIVNCRQPSIFALAHLALLKHDRTAKHRNRNRTSEFFHLNIGTSDILPESAVL